MHVLALTTEQAQAWATLIIAIGTAAAACIGAYVSVKARQEQRPPSNGVSVGTVAENTNVALHVATHLLAEALGKQVEIPSPRDTAAGLPGATISDPPPPSVVQPAPPSSLPPATPPAPAP